MLKALLVDPEYPELSTLREMLEKAEFELEAIGTLEEARASIRKREPDLVILEVALPDGDGLELLDFLQQDPADPEVVILTRKPSTDTAVKALRHRILDYLVHPADVSRLPQVLRYVSRTRRMKEQIVTLRRELRELGRFGSLVGGTPQMREVYSLIEKVAPTNTTVFIQGESGTGKELVAETIHSISKRSSAPFLPLNCGAVSPNLIESELFGHERGSFTGATRTHQGYFERAAGGTLFLDEITEMPTELQVKLLRVLETSTVTRIGGVEPIEVDTRVISATNRNPEEAVKEGKLREDLYFRLQVFPIRIPPLRERPDDIRQLATHFLKEFSEQYGAEKGIKKRALELLEEHSWPGNVRELKNVLNRAFILAEGDIGRRLLPLADTGREEEADSRTADSSTVRLSPDTTLSDAEKHLILAALDSCDGDKKQAARTLGISLRTLYNRLKEYKQEEEADGKKTATTASDP